MEKLVKREDNAYKTGAGRYVQERDLLPRMGGEIARVGKRPYIIGGPTALKIAGEKLLASIKKEGMQCYVHEYPGHCCHENAMKIASSAKIRDYDVIVGVGGGRIMDFTKLTAAYAKKPVVMIPTSSATCAAYSTLSVCYTPEGRTVESIFFQHEVDAVLVDMDIMCKQPQRLLTAGAYDALAKQIEILHRYRGKADSELEIGFKCAHELAELLGREIESKLPEAAAALGKNPDSKALFDVVYLSILGAGVVSGLSKGRKQTAIAHKFYEMTRVILFEQTKHLLHGELVAMGLIAQCYYNNEPTRAKRLARTMSKLMLCTCLSEAGVTVGEGVFEDYLTRIANSTAMEGTTEQDKQRLERALKEIVR